jgi:hypothetical protein
MLGKYKEYIQFIHIPFNNYNKGVQYVALDDFTKKYLFTTDITYVAHIDIDEFIVLKKHQNICDFINEYIVGDYMNEMEDLYACDFYKKIDV